MPYGLPICLINCAIVYLWKIPKQIAMQTLKIPKHGTINNATHMDWFTLILRSSLTLGRHDAGVQYMLKCSNTNACKEFPRVAFVKVASDYLPL
jgi:hypothetical protein